MFSFPSLEGPSGSIQEGPTPRWKTSLSKSLQARILCREGFKHFFHPSTSVFILIRAQGLLCTTEASRSRKSLEHKLSSLKSTGTLKSPCFCKVWFYWCKSCTGQKIWLILLLYFSQSEQEIIFKNTVDCQQVGGSVPHLGTQKRDHNQSYLMGKVARWGR